MEGKGGGRCDAVEDCSWSESDAYASSEYVIRNTASSALSGASPPTSPSCTPPSMEVSQTVLTFVSVDLST